MRFEFATAGRIIFGPGTLAEVPSIAGTWGRHAGIVTGSDIQRPLALKRLLEEQGIACTVVPIAGEPTTANVSSGVENARASGADMIIAMGGGSAIDAGKAIAALMTNQGDIHDYLEVVGLGWQITVPPLPLIAIPTTAGTGAEVTRNAVIASPWHRVKVSMRSPMLLPRLAVIDPELTYTLPRGLTAATGLDALTQLIEAAVTRRANVLSDGFCRAGLELARNSLRKAYETGAPEARADMSLAALLSGLALANAGLGAVHGLAAPLGGFLGAPHGLICARLLPLVCQINIMALRNRAPEEPYLARYTDVARILTDNPKADAMDIVPWLHRLVGDLNVPGLADFNLRADNIPAIVNQAQQASSMRGNPIDLSEAELAAVLKSAM